MTRVKIGEELGKLGASKGERITDVLEAKLLDVDQVLKVSLNKIYIAPQIRLQIHQDRVDSIVKTFPVENYPTIRKVDPVIDGDSVPAGYEFVLLTGEHRFKALEQLNLTEYNFKFVPQSRIKTKGDVIKHQYIENNSRTEMHIIEKARSLALFMKEENCSQVEAAKALDVSTSHASRFVRIQKLLTEQDIKLILDNGIKSERVVLNITKLIELGHLDWLSLVKQYAVNAKGEFDPELIYETTLKQIIVDITPVKASKPNTGPQTEATKTTTSGINAESVEKTHNPLASKTDVEKPLPTPPTDAPPVKESDTSNAKITTNDPVDNGKGESTPPPVPTTLSCPVSVEKQAALKLAARVLQQVVSGMEIEEILIELGHDLKVVITEDDGEDIYAMVQSLPITE